MHGHATDNVEHDTGTKAPGTHTEPVVGDGEHDVHDTEEAHHGDGTDGEHRSTETTEMGMRCAAATCRGSGGWSWSGRPGDGDVADQSA